MDETAPFVSLQNEDDLWDETDNSDDFKTVFEPAEEPKQRWNCSRSRVLLPLLVIVSIAFIITAIVLVVQISRHSGGQSNEISEPLCLTFDCIEATAEVMSYMNFSADPCEDFYNYACGGWEKENDIPDTESAWEQFSILSLKNDNFLKKRINNPALRKKYKDNVAVNKALTYYSACMNKSRINSLGGKPLLDLIEQIHSWNLTGKWNSSSWDFMKSLIAIQKLDISPFFAMFTDTDYFNSSINVLRFDQSGLGMSRADYIDNTTDYEKIRQAYKKLMIQTVALLGAKGEDAKRQMMDVYDLESKMAKITIPVSERRNIEKLYKRVTVRELMDYTGNTINWKDFLQGIFKDLQYPITDDYVVVAYALDYLRNISQLYKSTPKTTVANYMMWRVVHNFMGFLSEDFKKIYQEYDEVKRGTTEREPKWRECLYSTTMAFGMPLGLLFIDEKFTEKSKSLVEELIREIRKIFIENLDQVDWMDAKTRKAARAKANAILENIGYPDYLKNQTALAKKFAGLDPTEDYFSNALTKSKFIVQKNYEDIKKPADSKEWSMYPQVVNAYYSFSENKIVFPAGILQSPFYNKDRPRSLNYGGIGAVVGHEVTHGFDDNGRRFNTKGNLVKWWTNKSIEAFTKQTKCLVKQYSEYKFFGKNIKGAQTLGENIADNGGVKQAYQAYQRYVQQHGHERLLPGINATNDQLFFLGFAQVWCGKFRRQTALYQVANGVHTPGKYRVIGTLSNSKGFAEAYNCAAGTKMNPAEKCHVW